MTQISAADLAQMRDDIEELMPDTCTIQSVTLASDGQGSMTETWGTALASVACRLDFIRGNETLTSGAVQPNTTAMLSLPYDTAITTEHRVVHDSVTYNVTSVNKGQSWNIVKRAVLEVVS